MSSKNQSACISTDGPYCQDLNNKNLSHIEQEIPEEIQKLKQLLKEDILAVVKDIDMRKETATHLPQVFYTDRSRQILDKKLFYESSNDIQSLYAFLEFNNLEMYLEKQQVPFNQMATSLVNFKQVKKTLKDTKGLKTVSELKNEIPSGIYLQTQVEKGQSSYIYFTQPVQFESVFMRQSIFQKPKKGQKNTFTVKGYNQDGEIIFQYEQSSNQQYNNWVKVENKNKQGQLVQILEFGNNLEIDNILVKQFIESKIDIQSEMLKKKNIQKLKPVQKTKVIKKNVNLNDLMNIFEQNGIDVNNIDYQNLDLSEEAILQVYNLPDMGNQGDFQIEMQVLEVDNPEGIQELMLNSLDQEDDEQEKNLNKEELELLNELKQSIKNGDFFKELMENFQSEEFQQYIEDFQGGEQLKEYVEELIKNQDLFFDDIQVDELLQDLDDYYQQLLQNDKQKDDLSGDQIVVDQKIEQESQNNENQENLNELDYNTQDKINRMLDQFQNQFYKELEMKGIDKEQLEKEYQEIIEQTINKQDQNQKKSKKSKYNEQDQKKKSEL
ncbi:hypothetical protein PPERSA_04079 [Pseudocohnilembus persalinus]|uniref:Uncharacterized protein n=1 Tax=Pseudocohnilembus persalinus TaxID=266149 RepID=A0A0V0QL76_PSEPJ|nr:hypothetical protein PPERSA_04079 [Pseudocohnilembus persalinus]|eukprot:KRX02876.1 hypothetical protein PPERSA_04079 [Pseudocohnilembus persalinus]